MKLQEVRSAFKVFFTDNEIGKALMKQAQDLANSNLAKAMDTNSLDYLSRAKGNQEIIDLINNVLKTEVTPR